MRIASILLIFFLLKSFTYAQCVGHAGILHNSNLGSPVIGEPEMDAFFNITKPKLESFFGVKADVYFFDDKKGGQVKSLCSSKDPSEFFGTIRFGLNLLKNDLWVNSNGVYMTTAIMAHEYAHLMQCKVDGALRGWKRELQADFLAGYFLGRKSYNYEEQLDIQAFADSLFQSDWYNPFYYGLPKERAQALIGGYHHADMSLEEVYIKSLYDFNNYTRIDLTKKEYETCDFCFGLGITTRPSECPVCEGVGHLPCHICDNKGEFFVFGKMHSCKACEGHKRLTCHFCEGHQKHEGSKLCPNCMGKGKVVKKEKATNTPRP